MPIAQVAPYGTWRSPQSTALLVITSTGDRELIDNAVTARLVAGWQR